MSYNGVQIILLKENGNLCLYGDREKLLALRKIINKAVSSPRGGRWHEKTGDLELSVEMTESEEAKNEF